MSADRKRRVLFCVFLLAAVTAFAPCYGRIFLRWGAASKSNLAMENEGGKKAYASKITLNGGSGEVAVFKFTGPLHETAAKLSRIFEGMKFTDTNGSMSFGIARSGDFYIRILLLQPGLKDETIVFKTEQSPDDYERSKAPPLTHMLAEVPEFPGSSPAFFAHNEDTDMSLAVASTRSTETAVRKFYDSELTSAGWAPMFTGASSTRIYLRGTEVCFVMLAQSCKDGAGKITLLHKKHGMK